MKKYNRREILGLAARSSAAVGLLAFFANADAQEARQRRMTMDLVCGNLGISAGQSEAVELAARHGFESVGADASYLAGCGEGPLRDLQAEMKRVGLVFGAAGLPVDFRRDNGTFEEGLKRLPAAAAGLQRAGVDRMATWIMPCDEHLTYIQNFRQHALRLRRVAEILHDVEVRLGLEYVAPRTSWINARYSFIRSLAEMKDLVAEINVAGTGYVLDSWHWWHANDSAADILTLKGREVIAVDLNDAPAGIPKEEQVDGHRELPCATGVIDVRAFLNALNQIGYDGPVRAEPFNQAVNHMPKDEACAAAAAALRKAFALIV